MPIRPRNVASIQPLNVIPAGGTAAQANVLATPFILRIITNNTAGNTDVDLPFATQLLSINVKKIVAVDTTGGSTLQVLTQVVSGGVLQALTNALSQGTFVTQAAQGIDTTVLPSNVTLGWTAATLVADIIATVKPQLATGFLAAQAATGAGGKLRLTTTKATDCQFEVVILGVRT